jgi:hypothetical protein
LVIGGLAFGRPTPVRADSYSWVGAASGFWDDPLNWSPQTVPGPGDNVTIPATGSPITVTVRASVSVASLDLAAPHTLEIEAGNAVTVTASLQLNGGNLAASGPLSVSGDSTWYSPGESSVRGTFTNNGTLTITGFNHRLRGVLNNNGTIRHQSGKVYLITENDQSTTLNNAAPAVYNYISDVTLVMTCASGSGTMTFNNDGTLLKSAGNGESAISSEGAGCVPAFNNYGAIDVQTGTLRVDLGFTSTGTIHIASNTALNVTVPTSFLFLQGGSLTGTGNYYGNLYNSGLISPGASAGKLTINGIYIQDSLGVIQIDLGGLSPGNQYDQLEIKGNATLGGELRIGYFNNFIPVVGNSFLIMTFLSRSSNFQTVTGTLENSKLIVTQTSVRLETWSPPVLLPVILKK